MAGVDVRQAGGSDAALGGAALLQVGGQRHQDGHLHREDLQEDEQLAAHGRAPGGPEGAQGTKATKLLRNSRMTNNCSKCTLKVLP